MQASCNAEKPVDFIATYLQPCVITIREKQHCAIFLSPEHLSDTLAMEQPEKHGKKKKKMEFSLELKQLLCFKEKRLFSPPLKEQDECVYFYSRAFLVSTHSL